MLGSQSGTGLALQLLPHPPTSSMAQCWPGRYLSILDAFRVLVDHPKSVCRSKLRLLRITNRLGVSKNGTKTQRRALRQRARWRVAQCMRGDQCVAFGPWAMRDLRGKASGVAPMPGGCNFDGYLGTSMLQKENDGVEKRCRQMRHGRSRDGGVLALSKK